MVTDCADAAAAKTNTAETATAMLKHDRFINLPPRENAGKTSLETEAPGMKIKPEKSNYTWL